MSRPRVALLCDYPEEQWPSMDYVGEMILSYLSREHADAFEVDRVCPPFRHRFARWLPSGRNADRLLNRFVDYPRALRRIVRREPHDLYHLVDHSYSQLVHALPPGRTIVTCHDLDTFRCLLDPAREPRPCWFRAMARRILSGLQKAAAVVCDSEQTRDALLSHELIPAPRLRVIHLGTRPECSPDPDPPADAEAGHLLGPISPDAPPDLLHVGSNIPRKRIDVLLSVFAEVRRSHPGARLLKVGGPLTPEQQTQADALGVTAGLVLLPYLTPAVLAAVYRRASLVLQPSEAEGFGLPVAEALACGVPLLASDIPVLREVGAEAPLYRPVADVPAWTSAALHLLDEHRRQTPAWLTRRALGFARARAFHWSTHARALADLYEETLACGST